MPFNVSQIAEKAKCSQRSLDPNIILLHAGTDNSKKSRSPVPSKAPDRLGALVYQIIVDGPDATSLVA